MPNNEKECEICGGYFVPSRSYQIYCPECGPNAYRLKKKAKKNLIRIGRQYYDLIAPKYKHICKYCGKEFENTVTISDFCSGDCKAKYREENLTCEHCGVNLYSIGIKVPRTQMKNIFCSDKCKEEHAWQIAREQNKIGKCPVCNKEFIIPRGGRTYCSKECYLKDVQHKKGLHSGEHKCIICGKWFKKSEAIDKSYCSVKCRNIMAARQKQYRQRNEEYKRKVKEQKIANKKAKSEQYIKENGLCPICKTSYKDCERMQSNFRLSPKGAKFHNSLIIECPKFKK